MEVIQGLSALRPAGQSSVTVGFFDGVHRGHRSVIGRTVEVARERGLRSVAVTFDRHPREILSPGNVPLLLTTLRRKAELIEDIGVDALAVLEFTEEFSRWPKERFVEDVLVDRLATAHAVVGSNFTFGHKAEGTLESLSDLGAAAGFSVEGVGLLKIGGRPVSSTSIREALLEGALRWPQEALGRRHVVEGTVVTGAGRGKGLGWPTANLRTPAGLLLPGRGVYAGRAIVDGQAWAAAINIGVNPTFGEEPVHLEAHLLGYDGDLRDRVIAIEFWERIRDEKRFDSAEALSEQIARDVEHTRALIGSSAAR